MRTPFDAAVARHGPTVLRVCRAALGAGPDADDAWSETFLSALRAWPDLPEETNVEAWLVRVAHRRAVDVVRRGTRAGDPAGGADDVAALEALDARNGVGRSPAGGHAGGHDDDEPGGHPIWTTVATLPTRQRLCVAYRYLGGLAYADIAELTGGSEAAARRAAADGVAALRRLLSGYGAPDKNSDKADAAREVLP